MRQKIIIHTNETGLMEAGVKGVQLHNAYNDSHLDVFPFMDKG